MYGWRSERFRKMCSAQAVGLLLVNLREAHDGTLRPEDVVDSARTPGSILHKLFTWDDTVAAERYRRAQASNIIRDIRVITHVGTRETVKRLYIHVTKAEAGEAGYITIAKAAEDGDLSAKLLARAMKDLGAWRSRYLELRDALPELFDSIDDAVG